MLAMTYGTMATMCTAASRRSFMPSSASEQPRRSACAAANPGTTKCILQTGVLTSVSLFVLFTTLLFLVVVLVALISLLLIGLTRLVRLESLVGLIRGPAARTAQGE